MVLNINKNYSTIFIIVEHTNVSEIIHVRKKNQYFYSIIYANITKIYTHYIL